MFGWRQAAVAAISLLSRCLGCLPHGDGYNLKLGLFGTTLIYCVHLLVS